MDRETLGAFIAGTRRTLNMTQREMAERLHVTDKAVSKWERGLSYPDVTLLEPLAAALGLGVEELMACRRQADGGEEEPVKNLLDISRDTVRRERRRGRRRLAWALVLAALAGVVVFYCANHVSEQRETELVLKETVDGENYLYVELPGEGRLLRLRCGPEVDYDAIRLRDEMGDPLVYRLDCRWDRLTRRGTVTGCAPTGAIALGGLGNVTFEPDSAPLFGFPEVYYAPEEFYPDPFSEPRGQVFLCDVRFWRWDAEKNRRNSSCSSRTVSAPPPPTSTETGRTRWWSAPAGGRSPAPSTTWWAVNSWRPGRMRCPRS